MDTLRIGVLGAARIAPHAIVRPAAAVDDVEVVAVAARDRERATKFARKHRIPRVHDDYASLLSDPEIDAVYNPLPNGLHAEWTVKAIAAGKHVLCEKPFTANAEEAQRVATVAEAGGNVVMEAFHWRYHPLAERLLEIVDGGSLGEVRHLEATMCIPLPRPRDIRYRYDLGGGSMMDVGCYTVHIVRTLARAEPAVVDAKARVVRGDVDRWMRADLLFADGRTARVTCALWSSTLLRINAGVLGAEGALRVLNPTQPHVYHRITRRTAAGTSRERVPDRTPTYTHQLRAFRDAVRYGRAVPTGPRDAVANMTVIDHAYEAAGLPKRGA